MNSRIHPKYKTKYRVANWSEYDRGLVQRGDATVWLSRDAIAAWKPTAIGRRGGQLKDSDLAIETALNLRLVFHLPLRQTEGFLNSIFKLMNGELVAPDHTTLSRRSQGLVAALRRVPSGAVGRADPTDHRQFGAISDRRGRVVCRQARREGQAGLE